MLAGKSVALFALVSLTISMGFTAHSADVAQSNLVFKPFGTFKIFRTPAAPKSLVLVVSSGDGWNGRLDTAARALVSDSVIVAGIDIRSYQKYIDASKSKCSYPSGDLENLSKFIQAELKFADYELPIAVGLGYGASLVYGSFFQAPENTFMAAVGLEFCPAYNGAKPICNGDGMASKPAAGKGPFVILPSERALSGWTTIFASEKADKSACKRDSVETFTKTLKTAKFVDGAGDGQAALTATVHELLSKVPAQNLHAGSVEHLTSLPLVILEPAQIKRGPDDVFAIFYSGDGGWAGFDKDLSAELNNRGMPVVGLSTLSYFWKAKSPDECAIDLAKIIQNFQAKWGMKKVILLGYSFGADVLPFLVDRLPPDIQKSVAQITLMSSSGFGEFEFHFGHWLSSDGSGGMPMIPVLEKIKSKVRVQCLYGSEEKKPFCTKLDPKTYAVTQLPGGHRFDGDQTQLADTIQAGLSPKSKP